MRSAGGLGRTVIAIGVPAPGPAHSPPCHTDGAGATTRCDCQASSKPRRRTSLFHTDPGEILEPALRADKPFDMLRHRARVEVMHDEQPSGIVDDHLV